MLTDVFAALVLLVCLLWLVHGWLPLALQQRINHALLRLQLGLRQVPAWWRGRRASRQARAEAQGLIDRARRDRPAGGGQVHDGVIVFFLQIDTLTQKNSSRDNHLQNWLSRTACAFGAD